MFFTLEEKIRQNCLSAIEENQEFGVSPYCMGQHMCNMQDRRLSWNFNRRCSNTCKL